MKCRQEEHITFAAESNTKQTIVDNVEILTFLHLFVGEGWWEFPVILSNRSTSFHQNNDWLLYQLSRKRW